MDQQQEAINAMALARMGFYHMEAIIELVNRLGSATEVLAQTAHLSELIPDASPRFLSSLADPTAALRRAEQEYAWALQHHVSVLVYGTTGYPSRLLHCPDAPLVLYYMGSADLNTVHVINVVGTRRCTTYGQDLIRHLMADLRSLCPDILVVSGLAYGIDICAHREALAQGFDTVAVLAHGLDDLYPAAHRSTAVEMVSHGGLLTEFTTHTKADKMNFVRRNRIVAGMADATILVESAAKGGGLITCEIAQNYGRDVFAFPGSVMADESRGCNNLIRDNGAALITGASDLVAAMNWNDLQVRQAARQGIERQLFPDLSAEEQLIVDTLTATNDLQVNLITVKTGLPVARIMALLFTLEMKGVVKSLAGGMYHLLK